MIAEEAHGVEGFAGGTGGNDDFLAMKQVAGFTHFAADGGLMISRWFAHAPQANQAGSEVAFIRADECSAALFENGLHWLCVASVVIHASIHCGGNHQGAFGGQSSHGEQIITDTMRKFCHRVGGNAGAMTIRSAAVAEADMGNMAFAAPQVSIHIGFAPGDGLEGERGDELARRFQ